MPSQWKRHLIWLGLCGSLVGCQGENAWTASQDRSYSDNIQDLVEDKLEFQSADRTAAQWWESHTADEYQGEQAKLRDQARLRLEQLRREAAATLLEAGPVSLTDCLAYGLAYNRQIRARRAAVRSVGGDKLIAQSRFLPRLTFDLSHNSAVKGVGRNLVMGARAIQTLLEFGKDNPIDVALREVQREALFDYEQQVAEALSDVRRRFFTVLLKQQQVAERRKLRAEFADRYERMRKLAAIQRALELDVLTARLNVLSEDRRINALEKEIDRQKMDLLQAVGLPLDRTDFALRGEVEAFDLALRDAVGIAFRRSTRIAQARAGVFEQDRVVRQIIWEYFPQVRAQGGYRGSSGTFGWAGQSADRTYGLSGFGEHQPKPWNSKAFANDPDWMSILDGGWYWGLEMELPVFTGLERTGRFRRENALLDRARHLLGNEISQTELSVRKAYQTVLEEERAAEILRETVEISKKRLQINERLKELGQISDDALETFRNRFFDDQDRYFEKQLDLIEAREALRAAMRHFEPFRGKEGE